MPNKGKGGVIESICAVMAFLSAVVGVIGAMVFSEVSEIRGSGLYTYAKTEVSRALVAYWLVGGVGAAVFWYVLSGIGTALQWLESGCIPNHKDSVKTDHAASDGDQSVDLSASPDMVTEPLPDKETSEPIVEKTPEQIDKERRSAQNARFVSFGIIALLVLLFVLAVTGKLSSS